MASPVVVGIRREDDLADGGVGIADAQHQLGDPQVVGVDPVDRGEGAAEDVVAAAVLVGPLDRDHVGRLLDDTDQRGVTAVVVADPAAGALGEVEADLAEANPVLDLADRVGQGGRRPRGSSGG